MIEEMVFMRVLHIISGSDNGGAKNHLLSLCSGSDSLFESVIGCINKGVLYEQASSMGFSVKLFEQSSRLDLGIIKDITSFARNNKIDIINFHGAKPNFLYIFLRHKVSIPCVTTIHSDYRYDFINNKLKYVLFTPLNILALKTFNNFICVSGKVKKLLEEKKFSGRKYVVANGIDGTLKIKETRTDIRNKYGIPHNAFVYTMVARLHPIKNHKNLILAAGKLLDEYKDIRLFLIGDGGYEKRLKAIVKKLKIDNGVIFAGYQKNPLDFINAGDINVLTSFNETFPIVILEGALDKKTAICSDVGDIKDILSSENGFLINPKSPDDIYENMKQAYIKRDELGRMGEKLYKIVTLNYTIDKFHRRYFESYEEILAGDNNG